MANAATVPARLSAAKFEGSLSAATGSFNRWIYFRLMLLCVGHDQIVSVWNLSNLYVWIGVCVHLCMYLCIEVCMEVCYICMYVCMYVMYVCIYVTYACMYACMYVTYIHTYTHTYIHTHIHTYIYICIYRWWSVLAHDCPCIHVCNNMQCNPRLG